MNDSVRSNLHALPVVSYTKCVHAGLELEILQTHPPESGSLGIHHDVQSLAILKGHSTTYTNVNGEYKHCRVMSNF